MLICQQTGFDIECNPYVLSIIEEKLNEIKSISGEPWEFRVTIDGATYWLNVNSKKTKLKCPYLKEIKAFLIDRKNLKKKPDLLEEYPAPLKEIVKPDKISSVFNAIKMEGILAVLL